MRIQTDIPFSRLTTMRLGGNADFLIKLTDKAELPGIINWAAKQDLPILVLGDGSNMIVRDQGFAGLVVLNRLKGFRILEEDDKGATVEIAAGENWDDAVKRTVKKGLSGIEALSAIPGTVGATPVQNVGAYGQEISQTLVQLEAYDTKTYKFVTLKNTDCRFSYRNSRFKSLGNRRYIITSVTLRLSKNHMQPPFYESLQRYLKEHKIDDYSPKNIRKAVVAIRKIKLPDPKKIANTGSFFKNPIVTTAQANPIIKKYPDMPQWPMPDGRIKLAAGWLMEHAGLKGYKAHGMSTYQHNALVFTNQTARTYADLAAFQQEITDKVYRTFGIMLEQEPELL